MRFRPCIDIHNGKVKQIVGSSLNETDDPNENFVSDKDSVYYAGLYDRYDLRGGHAIILNKAGTLDFERSKKEAMKALTAYPDLLQIGGGINDSNAEEFIESGASHVIVTSFLFDDNELSFDKMNKLLKRVPAKKIVFDLSSKRVGDKYFITCNRWQTITDSELNIELLQKLDKYCDEFLIHAVDVEGKQNGIESDLVKSISAYKGNKITYAGGIRSFKDIEDLKSFSNDGMDFTIGSALDIFGGTLEFKKVASEYAR